MKYLKSASIAMVILLMVNFGFAQFTFVHITDLHIADGLSAGDYDMNGAMFKQLRDELNNLSPKPAFVIVTGDISHAGDYGSTGMYPAFTQYLYPSGITNPGPGNLFIDSLQTIPIYFTPGNHDFRLTNTPPVSSDLTNYAYYLCAATDYYFIYQNTLVLCMNSGSDDLRPLWEDSNIMSPEGSGFSNDQLLWLRNILDSNTNKRKIIAMHHPAVNEAGYLCDGTPYLGTIVDTADGSIKYNRTSFFNICDSNDVDVVLSGHVHQNVVLNRPGNIVNENWTGGTRYIQTGSVLNGCYRVVTVDSSFVTVSVPVQILITGQKQFITKQYLKISPNPFGDATSVEISTDERVQDFELKVYNALGIEVRKITDINTNKIIIEKGNMISGMYFLKVYKSKDLISTEKLIIK